jgi:16S rRNA (guanine966-N2)-methyltransferase
MRIVGGTAKGRRLRVPRRGTRPTSERVREALFNSLRGMVELEGSRVLDLFAGTGAVGLEALSRGAAGVVFVESDRATCEVLRRNVEAVGLAGATVRCTRADTALAGGTAEPYHLVFADPPYAFPDGDLRAVLAALCAHGWLLTGAAVVVERPGHGTDPVWPVGVEPITHRRYGDSVLWYGRAR